MLLHHIMSHLNIVSGTNAIIAEELQARADIIVIMEVRTRGQGKTFKQNGQEECKWAGTRQHEENNFTIQFNRRKSVNKEVKHINQI